MICHFSAPWQDKVKLHCLGKHINFYTHTHTHTLHALIFKKGVMITVQNTTQSLILHRPHKSQSDLEGGRAYDLLLTYSALDASRVGVGKETGDLLLNKTTAHNPICLTEENGFLKRACTLPWKFHVSLNLQRCLYVWQPHHDPHSVY